MSHDSGIVTGGALERVGAAGHPVAWQQMTQAQRDAYVPPEATQLIRKGIPDNTWEAYQRQWHKFEAWCRKQERTACPVTENTMLTYLAFLASLDPRPAPSTMWQWYSAVRFVHRMGQPPVPWECGHRLALAMAAYVQEMREAGWRPKRAPRAYPDFVRQMVDCCDLSTPAGVRDKAIILSGFFTASRASHMTIFRMKDVTVVPHGLEMYLPFSKGKTGKRPDEAAETFAIGRNVEHPQYDPVAAVLAWMQFCRALGIVDGPLFRPVDKHGNLKAVRADFRMASQAMTNMVKKYGRMAGLGDEFTFHSLRRGMATWMRELGLDPITIAETFGWSPSSRVFLLYMEEAKRWEVDAPAQMAFL